MKWIGLTGGIASGKSTVSALLKDAGIPVVDADVLAHKAVEKGSAGLKAVTQAFGRDLLLPDGSLDRKKLGLRVFKDKRELEVLESILHPAVRALSEEERKRLAEKGHQVAIYDVPLLYEKKMEDLFDGVIVVHATLEQQKERLKARNNLSDLEIHQRIQSQMKLEEKIKKAKWVVNNTGTKKDLETQVSNLIRNLENLTRPMNNP